MEDLDALVEMGLPLGPPGSARRETSSLAAARLAVQRLATDPDLPEQRLREPLLAWLSAFRHHWRPTWANEIGLPGDALIERLEAEPFDRNRYLKLRRIAIESLSRLI
ncbi:hypothetical protein AKJ08_1303 [Vulgatibacter incomptus]|uniref:Uncharacterized protein n=2 Tax=Vulgatibacter incomptus TaxID=1391653 RepID=A0A0K1PBY2_9BACT|nr:hypothetical protein AKJ08_1303 [Vulgatibacter incomptus]